MLRKGLIYARVSSREQAEEGFSIEAQLKLLREYALKNEIHVVKEFSDAETAKQTGRKEFERMLDYLEKTSVRIILVEKTDRLYRNFRDYVTIDEMEGLEIHLVKEGETLSKDSKSHQKFIHGIKLLMAKNYIDNLSEEVTKGLYAKAEKGQYPGQAPTGYLNVTTEEKEHIMGIDGDRAPLVKELFEQYATGNHSLDSLHTWAREQGLRSRYGKPICRANLDHILKNPVYYGDFVYGGKHYTGTHEPIVTRELWERTQRAFKKHDKPATRAKRDFVFSGMMTCAECGSAITAELKKGRYVYYHCSRSKRTCSNRGNYLREEQVAAFFEEAVKSIRVPEDVIEDVVRTLKESYADKNNFRDAAIGNLQCQVETIRSRRDKAYLDKLDGKIDENYWRERDEAWVEEIASLQAKLAAYDRADTPFYESGARILELAKNAYQLYLRGTSEEKRQILNLVVSNSRLNGTNIEYQMQSPFDLAAKWASHPPMLRD